jgi:hypothetical protein
MRQENKSVAIGGKEVGWDKAYLALMPSDLRLLSLRIMEPTIIHERVRAKDKKEQH